VIAALYTHYQNKEPADSQDSDSQDQEEVQRTSRRSRKSRRSKRKVEYSDSDRYDEAMYSDSKRKVEYSDSRGEPSTPKRSRKQPRKRKPHKRPRKVAHPPSSPFDSMKQKRGGDKQIGQFVEATSHSRKYSAGTKRMRAQSPSSRSRLSMKSSPGTGVSLSSGDEFGGMFGTASPSFGPEERLLAFSEPATTVKDEMEDVFEKATQQLRKPRVADSPINPHQLAFKAPVLRTPKQVANDDDQKAQ